MTTTTKTRPEQGKLTGIHKNPMEQKDITGKATLHKTPPLEVLQAADFFMSKRLDLATAKGRADSAAESLLRLLTKHKMTQVTVKDELQTLRRIVVRQGEEKLKIEKAVDIA